MCFILPQTHPLPLSPPTTHVHTYTHLFSFSLRSVAWPYCPSDRELLLSHRAWKLERDSVGKRRRGLGRGGEIPGGMTRTLQPLSIRTTPWPGATEIPCRPHRGFASSHSGGHLNTWYAHGHEAPFEVCPSSSLLVCVRLKKKKNLFGITEFLGKCQLSAPIVSGAGMHLPASEHVDSLR